MAFRPTGALPLTVDTGFTGSISLPPKILKKMKAKLTGYEKFRLATGNEVVLPIYWGKVKIHNKNFETWFVPGDPLVGMEFLAGFWLSTEFLFQTAISAPEVKWQDPTPNADSEKKAGHAGALPPFGFELRLDEQGREHEGDGREQFDEDVQRGACRVFAGVADGVADNRGLVRGRAFAAERAGLNIFLGVVPGAAAVIEEERHEDTDDGRRP